MQNPRREQSQGDRSIVIGGGQFKEKTHHLSDSLGHDLRDDRDTFRWGDLRNRQSPGVGPGFQRNRQMIKHVALTFLCCYLALMGSFAGIGLRSIEARIKSSNIQAISSIYFSQPIDILTEIKI